MTSAECGVLLYLGQVKKVGQARNLELNLGTELRRSQEGVSKLQNGGALSLLGSTGFLEVSESSWAPNRPWIRTMDQVGAPASMDERP